MARWAAAGPSNSVRAHQAQPCATASWCEGEFSTHTLPLGRPQHPGANTTLPAPSAAGRRGGAVILTATARLGWSCRRMKPVLGAVSVRAGASRNSVPRAAQRRPACAARGPVCHLPGLCRCLSSSDCAREAASFRSASSLSSPRVEVLVAIFVGCLRSPADLSPESRQMIAEITDRQCGQAGEETRSGGLKVIVPSRIFEKS
jgi:hypothetical protein